MDLATLSLAMQLSQVAISPAVRASQIEMLLTIADTPGLDQTEIANRTHSKRSSVSRGIDSLSTGRRDGKGAAAGLIEQRIDPDDDRRRLVYLTKKGQALLLTLQNL